MEMARGIARPHAASPAQGRDRWGAVGDRKDRRTLFKRLCTLAAGAAFIGLVIGAGHMDPGTAFAGGGIRVGSDGVIVAPMGGGHIDPNGATLMGGGVRVGSDGVVVAPMGGHIDPNGAVVSVAVD
jgi:hypothetical protein